MCTAFLIPRTGYFIFQVSVVTMERLKLVSLAALVFQSSLLTITTRHSRTKHVDGNRFADFIFTCVLAGKLLTHKRGGAGEGEFRDVWCYNFLSHFVFTYRSLFNVMVSGLTHLIVMNRCEM